MSDNSKPFIIPRIKDQSGDSKSSNQSLPVQYNSSRVQQGEFVSPILGRQEHNIAQVPIDDKIPRGKRYEAYREQKPLTVEEIRKNPEKYSSYGVHSSEEYRKLLQGKTTNKKDEWAVIEDNFTREDDEVEIQEYVLTSEEEPILERHTSDSLLFNPEEYDTYEEVEPKKVVREVPLYRPTPAPETKKVVKKMNKAKYTGFPLNFLEINKEVQEKDVAFLENQKRIINQVFQDFSYKAEVAGYIQGPTVTQFLIEIMPGTDVSKLSNHSKTLQMKLSVVSLIIQDPIPGKEYAGIEIPNRKRNVVLLGNLLDNKKFWDDPKRLRFALGLDVSGEEVYCDIDKMPHGLIAGTTGSGKSICIHSIIVSLLARFSPDDLRIILVDPKKVELSAYDEIPHLALPVVTDLLKAIAALKWAVKEMERRFSLFQSYHTRNLESFNNLMEAEGGKKIPYIVILIDELADLMAENSVEVENSIKRITSLARAAGIHLLVALQRPSTDIVRGSIKNNIPSRLAFRVASTTDSSTIIGHGGAEKLLSKGDMLLCDEFGERRIQAAFVKDEEITLITNYLREKYPTEYIIDENELEIKRNDEFDDTEVLDERFEEVARYVVEMNDASANNIMKRFKMSYNRVSAILDCMTDYKMLTEVVKGKQRDVLIELDELEETIEQIISERG